MAQKKIVVSEDDQYIADFITHIFRGTDFEVFFARDGQQALDLVGKEVPDLIIMDYMTPKLNAFQICQELNKDEKMRTIPKIIMTASGKDEIAQGLDKFGVRSLIKKPFFASELLKSVESALAQ